MKKLLLVMIGILVAFLSWSNPTRTNANDTIPQVEEDAEPKIIYYKSDRPDNNRVSYRSNSRNRGARIKTLSGSMNHSGGFGAISFKTTSFRDEAMVFAGARGGWIINRTLALGAEGYGIIPTAKYDDIEVGSEVLALGGYGGMFLELIFFSNEVVHITFPLGAGAGWLGYEQTEGSNQSVGSYEGSLVDDDVFWYVEPGADIEVNVARNFRLVFGLSRRYTQDLNILNTDGQALQKMNFFVTLKIGSF